MANVFNWNPEDLITTRSVWYIERTGFSLVGGLHTYNSRLGVLPVMFEEDKIYTFIENNKKPISPENLVDVLRDAIRKKDSDYPEIRPDYVELFDGVDWQDSVIKWLDLDKQDLQVRSDGLEPYWEVEEIPLCRPIPLRRFA